MLPILMPVPLALAKPILTFTASDSSTSNTTSYSFATKAIGTAAPDRLVAVAMMAEDDSAGAVSFSAVTIGGITAEIVSNRLTTGRSMAIYQALVPTGTTATVAFTTNVTCERAAISVYTITGWRRRRPTDDPMLSLNPSTVSSTLQPGAVAVYYNVVVGSGYTWTNATEDFDLQVESITTFSTASRRNTTGASETVTVTANSGNSCYGGAAVWR